VDQLRPLHEVGFTALRPLLKEEAEFWGRELSWDYSGIAGGILRGLDRGAVIGLVIERGERPIAYTYTTLDEGRAVLGAFFASAPYRGLGLEERLAEAQLAELASRGHDRIESQTLFSTAPGIDLKLTQAGSRSCERHYLMRSLACAAAGPAPHWRLTPVGRGDIDTASSVIFASHEGTLDAALNSTYASRESCQRFVEALVLHEGCGRFESRASFVLEVEGAAIGVVLTTLVGAGNGHICQVSVLPRHQRQGVGQALMRATLAALRREGVETASLSVTVDNDRAYQLYRQLGFAVRRRFAAHAWVRARASVRPEGGDRPACP
jgi:ribosomal protein S18 acetylase RimI-like enzyme